MYIEFNLNLKSPLSVAGTDALSVGTNSQTVHFASWCGSTDGLKSQTGMTGI